MCVVGPQDKSLQCLFSDNQDVGSRISGVCVLLDPRTSHYNVCFQTIKMLVAMLVVFVCCWTPQQVITMWDLYRDYDVSQCNEHEAFYHPLIIYVQTLQEVVVIIRMNYTFLQFVEHIVNFFLYIHFPFGV